MRVADTSPGQDFELRDLIDGERRITYYRRRGGDPMGRFVPTILFGFRQWNRDGELRVERIGEGTNQMTDGLATCHAGASP